MLVKRRRPAVHDTRVVVVGIAETGADMKAIRWAVDRAVAGGGRLRLVHAFECVDARSWTPRLWAYPTGVAEQCRADAEQLADTVETWCRVLAPGLVVEAVAVEGPAAAVLIAESETAGALVLGSRQLDGLSPYRFGSIGKAVVERAACPVAVVRHDPGARSASKVVVGLNLDHDGDALLDFAYELADQCALPLEAIACWRPPITAMLEIAIDHQDTDRALIELELRERIAPWREKYPHVEATATISLHRPVPELLERAGDVNPLVLGRRGRHPALSALGSVHLGALNHANCPVIIVPTG